MSLLEDKVAGLRTDDVSGSSSATYNLLLDHIRIWDRGTTSSIEDIKDFNHKEEATWHLSQRPHCHQLFSSPHGVPSAKNAKSVAFDLFPTRKLRSRRAL